MTNTNILAAFNDHFYSFVNEIHELYPADIDIASLKNYFLTLRKINPKLIISAWDQKIVVKYKEEIDKGDLTFFLEKDYTSDLNKNSNNNKILDGISRLRAPINLMNEENKSKSMKYIQNLTKLCIIYFNK
jgi:hypothetical protein